jgi:hypothetical protein
MIPTMKIVKPWNNLSVHAAEKKDQELSIFVFPDGNGFEDELEEIWLEEVRKATGYYLCQIQIVIERPPRFTASTWCPFSSCTHN